MPLFLYYHSLFRYMSHFIGKDELAKARATAEKALTTINYRYGGEREDRVR